MRSRAVPSCTVDPSAWRGVGASRSSCAGRLPSATLWLAGSRNVSTKEPGQHANAFRNVCLEMSGALSQARPCLLQASGGQRGQPAKEIWNGEEVVEVAEELLLSPHVLDATTPAAELHAGVAHDRSLDESRGHLGTVEGEEEGEDEDVEKNWRRPTQDTDFAAHAGRVEKEALKLLGINVLLNGREIGPSHGLDSRGMMTPEALRPSASASIKTCGGRSAKMARWWRRHESCCGVRCPLEHLRLRRGSRCGRLASAWRTPSSTASLTSWLSDSVRRKRPGGMHTRGACWRKARR